MHEQTFEKLEKMVAYLREMFAELTDDQAAVRPCENEFAPVEQAWHLADLEREGFGARILLILSETSPILPNFEGQRLARERNYLSRSLADGLDAFAAARTENLGTLR